MSQEWKELPEIHWCHNVQLEVGARRAPKLLVSKYFTNQIKLVVQLKFYVVADPPPPQPHSQLLIVHRQTFLFVMRPNGNICYTPWWKYLLCASMKYLLCASMEIFVTRPDVNIFYAPTICYAQTNKKTHSHAHEKSLAAWGFRIVDQAQRTEGLVLRTEDWGLRMKDWGLTI